MIVVRLTKVRENGYDRWQQPSRPTLRQRKGKAEHDCGKNGSQGDLLDALLERLVAEGAPSGIWLVDIARVRSGLREADALLLKMQNAILAELPPLGE
jgi:hypothetical protein